MYTREEKIKVRFGSEDNFRLQQARAYSFHHRKIADGAHNGADICAFHAAKADEWDTIVAQTRAVIKSKEED